MSISLSFLHFYHLSILAKTNTIESDWVWIHRMQTFRDAHCLLDTPAFSQEPVWDLRTVSVLPESDSSRWVCFVRQCFSNCVHCKPIGKHFESTAACLTFEITLLAKVDAIWYIVFFSFLFFFLFHLSTHTLFLRFIKTHLVLWYVEQDPYPEETQMNDLSRDG